MKIVISVHGKVVRASISGATLAVSQDVQGHAHANPLVRRQLISPFVAQAGDIPNFLFVGFHQFIFIAILVVSLGVALLCEVKEGTRKAVVFESGGFCCLFINASRREPG
jgi:hypothetical protein